MKCEICGGRMVCRKVAKQHWLDRKLYVIEGVDALVCPDCGERYYHATTLDAIDAMLRGQHTVKKRLQVEVVAFREVA